jgi:hypothetical protein
MDSICWKSSSLFLYTLPPSYHNEAHASAGVCGAYGKLRDTKFPSLSFLFSCLHLHALGHLWSMVWVFSSSIVLTRKGNMPSYYDSRYLIRWYLGGSIYLGDFVLGLII